MCFFHVTKERQTDDDGRGEVLVVDDGPFHTQGRLGKDVSIAQVTMYNCFLEKRREGRGVVVVVPLGKSSYDDDERRGRCV